MPGVMTEVSISRAPPSSPPPLLQACHKQAVWYLTSQPVCWATAGRLCHLGCTAARHTTWSASAAHPPAFALLAHTPWHLRVVTETKDEQFASHVKALCVQCAPKEVETSCESTEQFTAQCQTSTPKPSISYKTKKAHYSHYIWSWQRGQVWRGTPGFKRNPFSH